MDVFISWSLLLSSAVGPLAMLATVFIVGHFFRKSIRRSMDLAAAAAEEAVQDQATQTAAVRLAALKFDHIDLAAANDVTNDVSTDFLAAGKTRWATQLAFTTAAVIYAAINTTTIMCGMASLHEYRLEVYAAVAYMMQWPVLIALLWLLDFRLSTRLVILGSYLLVGLLLASFAPSYVWAVRMVSISAPLLVIFPLAGLLLLQSRRLRPWLLVLAALVLLFSLTTLAMSLLHLQIKRDEVKLWAAVVGTLAMVGAVVLMARILGSRSWKVPVASLVALTLAGAGLLFVPKYRLLGSSLLSLPSNVVQLLIVWLLFKSLVLLQERRLLPSQVLQSHLCWAFLSLIVCTYIYPQSMFGHLWWERWALVSAYVVYLIILSVLLRLLWKARSDLPGKRLLLLRVFGASHKRQKLMNWLDNSWRFIGRIDMIAATDLAELTLASGMLEAFLLRRAEEQFLKTPADVNRRLSCLYTKLEGDVRYPVNSVYCYSTAWRRAVERLVPVSDVVLMDLRGFTLDRQGCIFELQGIVQRLNLSRIILLADSSTDYSALEVVARQAWAHVPSDSPSVGETEPALTVVNVARSSEARDRLLALLLRAADAPDSYRAIGQSA